MTFYNSEPDVQDVSSSLIALVRSGDLHITDIHPVEGADVTAAKSKCTTDPCRHWKTAQRSDLALKSDWPSRVLGRSNDLKPSSRLGSMAAACLPAPRPVTMATSALLPRSSLSYFPPCSPPPSPSSPPPPSHPPSLTASRSGGGLKPGPLDRYKVLPRVPHPSQPDLHSAPLTVYGPGRRRRP